MDQGGASSTELKLDPEDEHLREHAKIRAVSSGHVYAFVGPDPLHRVIMGRPKKRDVDHRNGDTLDNRKTNLRVVTRAVNNQNSDRRMPHDPAKTPYKGVGRHVSGLWYARLKHNGRVISFGYHSTPEDAHLARLKGELELWGINPRRAAVFAAAGVSA